MHLVVNHDAEVAAFVARLMPLELPEFAKFTAIGVVDGTQLVAGVVFSDWRPEFGTIELSGAATDPRAFSPKIIRAIGSYPFEALDCFRVWARTATANKRARKFLLGLGFKEEGVNAHHYGAKRHAVMLRVLKPEWQLKWGERPRTKEDEHGRRRSVSTPSLSGALGP